MGTDSHHIRKISVDSEMEENFKKFDNQRSMLRQKGTENIHNTMIRGGSLESLGNRAANDTITGYSKRRGSSPPALGGRKNIESQETLKEANRYALPDQATSPRGGKNATEIGK